MGQTVTITGGAVNWNLITAVILDFGGGLTSNGGSLVKDSDSLQFEVPVVAWDPGAPLDSVLLIVVQGANTDTLSPQLAVYRPEPTGVDAGNDETICTGGSVSLSATASPSGGSYSYLWSPATGLSGTSGATVTASPTTTTTYKVVVTGATCGLQDSAEVTVNVRATPVLNDVTVTPPSCPGVSDAEVEIDASGSAPLEFRLGNSGYVSATNPITGRSAGTYDLTLRYTNNPRCEVVFPDEVVISDPVLPTAEINSTPGGDPIEICAGESVTFSATERAEAVAYYWDFGRGAAVGDDSANGRTPDPVLYADGGTYTVYLRMDVTAAACQVWDSIQVIALDLPAIDAVEPTSTSDCGADDGSVYVEMTGGPTGFQFRLTGNGITRDWQDSEAFEDLPAGSYTVSVRYDDAICPVEWPDPVVVSDPGAPQSAINLAPLVACAGEPIEISAPPQAGVTFTWDFGEGASPSAASGPGPHVVTYATDGPKDLTLDLVEGECVGSEANDDLIILQVPAISLSPLPADSYTDGDT
ncbi:MAG: hypothetical protein D6722_05070, partial [Bacteroidetes bacterium]